MNPLKVRRAVICLPHLMEDAELREVALNRFGTQPAWVVCVSRAMYDLLGETNHPAGLRLAVSGSREEPCDLVMLLQLSGHQLRCVSSLQLPLVQQAIEAARESGVMRLIVSEDGGPRFAGYECEVTQADLDALARLGPPPKTSEHEMHRGLTMTALRCLLIDELPSVVPDSPVKTVEVAIVAEHVPHRPGSAQ